MTHKTTSEIARATPDDVFEANMRQWGRAYGPRVHDDEPSRSRHAIAQAMECGMTREQWLKAKIAGRDGRSRRTLMARDLESCGVRIVRMDYVDHVRCKDDSGRHRGLSADPLETPQVRDLQAAWHELHRCFPDQAAVVLMAYQRPDLQTNAARASALGVTLRTYEDKLRLARQWMRAGVSLMRAMAESAKMWP